MSLCVCVCDPTRSAGDHELYDSDLLLDCLSSQIYKEVSSCLTQCFNSLAFSHFHKLIKDNNQKK